MVSEEPENFCLRIIAGSLGVPGQGGYLATPLPNLNVMPECGDQPRGGGDGRNIVCADHRLNALGDMTVVAQDVGSVFGHGNAPAGSGGRLQALSHRGKPRITAVMTAQLSKDGTKPPSYRV
jgi:hypothetical protein